MLLLLLPGSRSENRTSDSGIRSLHEYDGTYNYTHTHKSGNSFHLVSAFSGEAKFNSFSSGSRSEVFSPSRLRLLWVEDFVFLKNECELELIRSRETFKLIEFCEEK